MCGRSLTSLTFRDARNVIFGAPPTAPRVKLDQRLREWEREHEYKAEFVQLLIEMAF